MSKLEQKALKVIRGFEGHWPLSDADRAPVAEFLALQLMRSPMAGLVRGGAQQRSPLDTRVST